MLPSQHKILSPFFDESFDKFLKPEFFESYAFERGFYIMAIIAFNYLANIPVSMVNSTFFNDYRVA